MDNQDVDAKEHDQRRNEIVDKVEKEDINRLVSLISSLVESSTSKMKAWELENGMPYVYNKEQTKLLGQLVKDFEAMFGPKGGRPLVFNVEESAVFDKILKGGGRNISPSLLKLHGTTILIVKMEDAFTAIVADGRVTIAYENLPDYDHVLHDKACKVEKVWDTYLATLSGDSKQGQDIVRSLNSAPKARGITKAINAVEKYVVGKYGQKIGLFSSSVCVVGEGFCRLIGSNMSPVILEEGLEVLYDGYGGIHALNHLKKVKVQELKVFDSALEHMKQAVAVSSIKECSAGGNVIIGKIKDEKVEIEKCRPHVCDIIARDFSVFKYYLENSLLVYTEWTDSTRPSTEYRIKLFFEQRFPRCKVVILRAKRQNKEIIRLVTFRYKVQLAAAVKAFSRGEIKIKMGEKRKVYARYELPSAEAFKEIVAFKKDLKRQVRKANGEKASDVKKPCELAKGEKATDAKKPCEI